MNRFHSLLFVATLLSPLPALAVTDPTPGPRDSRVRSTPYDQQQVVRLTSTGLAPLQVIFEAGEKPLTIAGPMVFTKPEDAKDWLARPSGNVLILQPLHDMAPSVLFVRTSTADGQERSYAFELRTRDGDLTNPNDSGAYMTVRFAYKPAPNPALIAEAAARRQAAASAASARVVQARLAQAQVASRNYNYDKRDPEGCPLLAPQYVFDDGNRTTMVFAPHSVLPEIYAINQDGKEAVMTTINETTATGLEVVIPNVYRQMRLRRGGKVCALRNNAFDPVGAQPGGGTGTVSPDVVRQVRTP
jgi:type IV secretion system protein VirB9